MADIVQVVAYEGDNTTFVWKSPVEDFYTGTQLIVHESQEAVFFMNGQALDLFGPGRHTLESQNIPLLSKLLNIPTKNKTPFHCEVYFINKTEQMAIKWGTDSQVQYMEPTYNFPLKIGASGEMTLRVADSRKLLIKVVGTEHTLGQAKLTEKFRAFLMVKVKPYLSQTMRSGSVSIFDIDSQIGVLSDELHQLLSPDFLEYGLALEKFFVTTIARPEGDPAYMRFSELAMRQYADIADAKIRQQVDLIDQNTEVQKMIMEAQGLAKKRETEGYTYQQEQGFEVSKLAAQNEGAGNFSSAGIGLGMMSGIAGGMGATIANVTNNAMSSVPQNPVNSQPGQDAMTVLKQKIDKLKMMKESGLISDDEWETERKKLLETL